MPGAPRSKGVFIMDVLLRSTSRRHLHYTGAVAQDRMKRGPTSNATSIMEVELFSTGWREAVSRRPPRM